MRAIAILAAGLSLAGCATWSASFRDVETHLTQEHYAEALQALDRQGDVQREPLLYHLNKAMMLRMAGDYRGSNEAFEAAKKYIEEYSAISLREEAATFVINDAASSYAGEEHEQIMVHLYEALNYIALGDLDNARVEALQVDVRLRQQAERAKQEAYHQDAFARYLTGMIYEDLGEWSDALIAYRKSYEAYQKYPERYGVSVPTALKYDLLRLTEHLGLKDEMRRYKKEFGIDKWAGHRQWREQGELIFVLHNGLAPIKREQAANVLDAASGHLIRIALPYYETRAPLAQHARITIGEREVRTELYENVQKLALRTLEAKSAAITARALARAIVKTKLAHEVRKQARQSKDGDAFAAALLGFGLEVAAVLTERADTRSWATLPNDIQLARLALPAGTYTVKIDLLGAGDSTVGTFELRDIVIRPGHKTYLSRHWIASQASLRSTP